MGNTNFATYLLHDVMDYFPYGKSLRAYHGGAGEKFLSTHHQRDPETEWDYRGARFYDGEIGRFLGVDPLAMNYPSLSGYNYVAGNPLILVDPHGLRTYFYDEDNNLLHVSDDLDEDAINIIPNHQLSSFLSILEAQKAMEIGKEHDGSLRQTFGTNYIVSGIVDFTERAIPYVDTSGEYFEKDKYGNLIPAHLETGNYLNIEDGNQGIIVRVSGEKDIKGTKPATVVFFFGMKIHYHPNNSEEIMVYEKRQSGNLTTYIPGRTGGDLGPSKHDLQEHSAPNGRYNIVTGKNKNDGYSIYFYRKGMEKEDIIKVPFSVFQE